MEQTAEKKQAHVLAVDDLLQGGRVIPPFALDCFKGKRVFVTGCCGSIGKPLYKKLVTLGAEVSGIDQDEYSVAEMCSEGYDVELGDFRSAPGEWDVAFHCAAYKHVSLGEKHQGLFWYNNVSSLFEWVNRFKNKRVILCSTDKAAGATNMGQSKKGAEDMLMRENDRGGKHSALRLVNCVGSRGSVIDRWTRRIKTHLPPKVCPFHVERYWMQMEDAVDALLSLYPLAPGVYTVYDMPKFTMGEMLEGFLQKYHKAATFHEMIPLGENEAETEAFVTSNEQMHEIGISWLRKIESQRS